MGNISFKNYHLPYAAFLTLSVLLQTVAAEPLTPMDQLLKMNLSELFNVEITSVDKKSRKLSESAAAAFVITATDIRRAGARSIPEALRMVPGVQVARINASSYAIGVRGFNSSFSNKLLVLVDGRSVYTPDFSGVYWEMTDYPLDDIERIEVIRGPGGTLWGANAVNGVINIITKHAGDSQGTLLKAGSGDSEEKYFATVRHGGTLNAPDTYYRAYAQTRHYHDFPFQAEELTNLPVSDHWRSNRAGFRIDSVINAHDSVNLQGNVFRTVTGETQEACAGGYCELIDVIRGRGVDFLTRWTRNYSDTSSLQLQLYTDYIQREDYSLISFRNKTLDIELQHRFRWKNKHDILWGLGYRDTRADTYFALYHDYRPPVTEGHLFNVFVQDDIALSDTWRLTVGSKFEKHYYTGWALQPNARLLWQASETTTWWGAISHAVRTPSRFEFSAFVEIPEFNLSRTGNDQLDEETLTSYELGWRHRYSEKASLDISVFFNDYDKLIVVNNFISDNGVDSGITENGMQAESYGLEITANWFVKDWWRLHAAYSWLVLEAHLNEGIDTFDYAYDPATETRDPEHQISLRSSMDLAGNYELDVWLRYTGQLEQYSEQALGSGIDSHLDLDIRLAWHLTEQLELSLTGRNLLKDKHDEFGQEPRLLYYRNSIPRSVYAQVKWDL